MINVTEVRDVIVDKFSDIFQTEPPEDYFYIKYGGGNGN